MVVANLVSVGIVIWNSARDLPNCLEGLSHQDYPFVEIILVDNASTDNSLQIAHEKVPNVFTICNTENFGFCGGHNQGIRASHGKYYLPLNPDVVMEPGFISAMVEALERDSQYGMAAGRLYLGVKNSGPRRIDSTGLLLDRKRRQFLRGFEEDDRGQFNRVEEVFGVDGAAPLYRRAMLEDICIDGQYFDEAFHSHKEDVDLAWRARILGWGCIYTPDAVGYHKRTFQPGKRRKDITDEVKLNAVKNRYLLLLKNESAAGWRRDGIKIALYDLKILIYLLLFERSSLHVFPLLKKNWARAMAWRREIQRRAKVAPENQIAWFKR